MATKQAKSFVERNKRAIITGSLLLGAGVGAYALMKPTSTSVTPIPTPEPKPKPKPIINRKWRPAAFSLVKGMAGDVVAQLQIMLQKMGAKISSADGKFGAQTEAALRSLNLSTVVDINTFQSLKAKLTKPIIPLNETPYQRLIRLKYNPKKEIDVAIKLQETLNSAGNNAQIDAQVKSLLNTDIRTLTNIYRAYRELYQSDLKTKLSSLTLGQVRFSAILARLQAVSKSTAGLGSLLQPNTVLKTIVGTRVVSEVNQTSAQIPTGTILGKLYATKGSYYQFVDSDGNFYFVPISDVNLVSVS